MKETQLELTSSRLKDIRDKLTKALSTVAEYNIRSRVKRYYGIAIKIKGKLSQQKLVLKFQPSVKLSKGHFHLRRESTML